MSSCSDKSDNNVSNAARSQVCEQHNAKQRTYLNSSVAVCVPALSAVKAAMVMKVLASDSDKSFLLDPHCIHVLLVIEIRMSPEHPS